MPAYDIRQYSALGNGHANDASAIQAAIDACNSQGGGMVVVSAGSAFLASTLELKSHVNLFIERSARLLAGN